MKKLIVSLVVIALTLGLVLVALAEDEGVGFSLTTSYHPSGWIDPVGWRTPGSMFLTEINQELPHGFYAGIWNLTGLDEANSDETDFNLGWAGDFAVAGIQFSADVGAGYWDLRDRFSSGGSQTDYWNFWVEFGRELNLTDDFNLLPYVRAEYLEPVQINSEFSEGGFFAALGVRLDWEAGKIIFPLTLSADIRAIYDSGLYGGEVAWIGRWTVQASWQVTDYLAVILPGMDLSQPFAGDLEDGRGTELVTWIGISLSF